MDDTHQFEAAACQSQSLLPPPAGAGASPCFHGVSLLAAAGACLSLVAASYAVYCLCIAIVSSNKESRLLKLKVRNSKKKKNQNQGNNDAPPPPPPRRGDTWWWSAVETLAFLAAKKARYGPPCFRTALFGATHVFVSSPTAARSLLAAEPAGFSKRYVRTVAELLGEHSLLCASHAAHRSLRRAVAPLFSSRTTASFAAAFGALTRRLMRDWRASCSSSSSSGAGAVPVVVLDAALGITFEAICDMLVATLPRDAKRRLQGDVLAVTRAMLAFPLRLPGTRFHAGLQARKRIMETLRREIASRRRNGSLRPQHGQGDDDMDFLQSLLLRNQQQQSDNDEALLTDEQIIDNTLTLIITGKVTTATAVTWMVKYLADNRLPRNLKVGSAGAGIQAAAPGFTPYA